MSVMSGYLCIPDCDWMSGVKSDLDLHKEFSVLTKPED